MPMSWPSCSRCLRHCCRRRDKATPMAINSIGSSMSVLGQSVLNIKNQLTTLQSQLATGEKATTYAGMGTGEGFAIAARSQLAQISGYQNTITNVGTTIDAANTALQG